MDFIVFMAAIAVNETSGVTQTVNHENIIEHHYASKVWEKVWERV